MGPRILYHQGCECGCGCGGSGAVEGSRDWAEAPDDALVCPCLGVTKAQVIEAIQMGAATPALVKTMTKLGHKRDCELEHRCLVDLQVLLEITADAPLSGMLRELGGESAER